MLVLACLSASHSDALSAMDEFWFFSPGITLTRHGPGVEISGGRNGLGSGEFVLLGALLRNEPSDGRMEVGLEAGIAVFLLEAGVTYSHGEFSGFFAPDLCIPIYANERSGVVTNLYYRVYPSDLAVNTLGASVKLAWMR